MIRREQADRPHAAASFGTRIAVWVGVAGLSIAQSLRRRGEQPADDRGEGPVSTAIMVALIAAVAVAVGGVILVVANSWTDKIPRATP